VAGFDGPDWAAVTKGKMQIAAIRTVREIVRMSAPPAANF
jgi:hypothetical protein